MITDNFTLGIAVILFTGLLFGKIAKKCNIPNVTGYLVGGLLIGPMLFGLIFSNFGGVISESFLDMLEIVVNIELGFIAFTIGSEFKVSYFKQVGMMPVIVAFAESFGAVLFIFVGVFLVGLLFGVPVYFALCLAAVGGATAPAATIMVVRQYRAKGEFTRTLFSVVAIDDASALIYFGIAMAIVKSIISPGSGVAISIIMPFVEIIASLALGLVVGFLLTLLIKAFGSKGNRLVLVIATVFVVIGLCVLVEQLFGVELSSLLACMALGAVFANTSKQVEEVVPLVENITPPLVVIFFIMSGARLELGAIGLMGVVLLVTYLVFRVAGKIVGTMISAKACGVPKKVRNWMGFGLLPQGGIAIGLSLTVAQTLNSAPNVDPNFSGALLSAIVLCAVFISEIFGPILCKFALFKTGEAQVDPKPKRGASGELAKTTSDTETKETVSSS